MNAIRTIVLGAGYRGRAYAAYAAEHPDRMTVVGVADPVRPDAIAAPVRWHDWRDALAARPQAELAVVALPDAHHHDAAIAALEAGYHVLLEKPVATTEAACRDVIACALRHGRLLMVGHVLRFTPYFAHVKALIDSGEFGDVVSVSHQESVAYWKFAHSFVRGNWANATASSPVILQKCSHDFDLFVWWIGRRCRRVSSLGSISLFRPANRPSGSAERCTDCPAATERACPWSARKIYLGRNDLAYLFPGATREDLERLVRETDYGRCVFDCSNDVPDHQSVLLEFEGGATAALTMTGLSTENVRSTRISLTRGEIVGDGERLLARRFDGVHADVPIPLRLSEPNSSRHGGGDFNLIAETIRLIRKADDGEIRRVTREALDSHLIAFAAERSRLAGGAAVEPGDPVI